MKTHFELVDVEFWQPMPKFEVFPEITNEIQAWVAQLNKYPRPKGPRYQIFRVDPKNRPLMGTPRKIADQVDIIL